MFKAIYYTWFHYFYSKWPEDLPGLKTMILLSGSTGMYLTTLIIIISKFNDWDIFAYKGYAVALSLGIPMILFFIRFVYKYKFIEEYKDYYPSLKTNFFLRALSIAYVLVSLPTFILSFVFITWINRWFQGEEDIFIMLFDQGLQF